MAITLKAKKRDDLARSVNKQLRIDGFIPAVVYGKTEAPVTISVENLALLKTVRDEGRNAIISLDIEDGSTVDVMLHEYQTDKVKRDIIHVDFYVVDMSEAMDVTVAIRIEGDPIGAKDGGILQQPLYELTVRAKPRDIPDEIVIDVAELAIGDSISIADLPVSKDYEFVDEGETTVVLVSPPEEEVEESDGEVDFSAEPELVGAKDEEDEE